MEANLTEFIARTMSLRRKVPTRLGRRVREMLSITIEPVDIYDVIVVHRQESRYFESGSKLELETAYRLFASLADRERVLAILDEMGVGEAYRYTQVNDAGCIWMKLSLTADDDFGFCVEMYRLFDLVEDSADLSFVDGN